MSFISKKTLEEIRKIDLLTYFMMTCPDELVKIANETYCTKTHDSLKISNGLWMWWSRGIGGKNALDYLIKVEGMSFYDAANHLVDCKAVCESITYENKKNENRVFKLPEKADSNSIAISYLTGRGIDKDVINEFIRKGFIYQSRYKNNVVFTGSDENGKARYASMRGTEGRRFFMDVRCSDKTYSFRYINESSEVLHLFESAIDLLSFITLMKRENREWKNESYISLSGVYTPKNNSSLPRAISGFLQKSQKIREINLHLDNDDAGKNAAQELKKILGEKYKVKIHTLPFGKDVNEYLMKLNERRDENGIN